MVKNPWLEISISDYVNHMRSPEVMQYQLINECFKYEYNKFNPKRIFVPGCTIGNGFEYINWESVESITALDINCEYLSILKDKFKKNKKLEIINDDLLIFKPGIRKFDLIFAALIFEYVDLISALKKMKKMMHTSSILFSMTQLPGKIKVTKTKYKALEKLSPVMHLITEIEFQHSLKEQGFYIKKRELKILKSGKSFLLTEAALKL